MNVELSYPVYLYEKNRAEVLLVEYDGFIKSISEGIIQYMLSEIEDWIDKYPGLTKYENLEIGELYEQVFLYDPFVILREIAKDDVDDFTIIHDMKSLREELVIECQSITSFEFALFKLLQEDFIKKCIIIKGNKFYDNEKEYIEDNFEDVIDKIELVEGGILDVIRTEKPTTLFLSDFDMLFDYIIKSLDEKELQNKVFVMLNTYYNTEYDEETGLLNYLYEKECDIANHSGIFSISRMYNQAIDETIEDENDYDEDEEDEED